MKNRREMIDTANAFIRAGDDPAVLQRMSQLRPQDVINIGSIRQWARAGMQSVQMPDTYEAGLMASDCAAVLDPDEPLPWPAFEIQLSGIALKNKARIFSITVCDVPEDMVFVARPGYVGAQHTPRILAVYREDGGIATTNWYPSLLSMFDPEMQVNPSEQAARNKTHTLDELDAYGTDQRERRVWSLVARLICGVIIAINTERAEHRDSFSGRSMRTKHGAARPTTWQLGKPLKIDCRAAIGNFIEGHRNSLATQHLRRGHYRNQPFGEGLKFTRRQWIHPCWVGDGPLLVRPVKLGFNRGGEQ